MVLQEEVAVGPSYSFQVVEGVEHILLGDHKRGEPEVAELVLLLGQIAYTHILEQLTARVGTQIKV